MMTILNTIVIGLMLVTTTAQSPDCRPSIQFYHIAHGAISARIDELVLNRAYKITYIVRQKIQYFQQKPAAALTIDSTTLYLIQSECHSASSKVGIGISVTLIDAVTNSSQTITYPMGFNKKPITFISHRGEQLLIECVDSLLFSFNIMLKNSNEVVAQVRRVNFLSNYIRDLICSIQN